MEVPPVLTFRSPVHRVRTFLVLALVYGLVFAFLFMGYGWAAVPLGLLCGSAIGFLGSRPELWELEGSELRQIRPKHRAGAMPLPQVVAIEIEPMVKGGVIIWAVHRLGAKLQIPDDPGRQADAFRRAIFTQLPAKVLAEVDDPYLKQVMEDASLEGSAEQ